MSVALIDIRDHILGICVTAELKDFHIIETLRTCEWVFWINCEVPSHIHAFTGDTDALGLGKVHEKL